MRYNIDTLRFALTVGIVVFHVLVRRQYHWTVWNIDTFKNASAIVQCFFILSGFCYYLSTLRNNARTMQEFVCAKIARLWPMLFAVHLWLWFLHQVNGSQLIMNSVFLQCVGLTKDFRGMSWFVSPLFWALIFYHLLFSSISNSALRNLWIGILVWLGYVVNISAVGGFARETTFGIVPLAFAQAIAGVGIGILVGNAARVFWADAKTCRAGIVFYGVLEIVFLVMLGINLWYFPWACSSRMVIVVAMVGTVFLFAGNCGFVSRMLDSKTLSYGGRFGYSIYMVQPVVFWYLDKWHRMYFSKIFQHDPASEIIQMIVYTTIIVICGIAAYYLIEVPFRSVLDRRCSHLVFFTKKYNNKKGGL